jgi:exopolysaccharide production protein ExoQ
MSRFSSGQSGRYFWVKEPSSNIKPDEVNMLSRRIILIAEPFAYAVLFLLTIRRIIGNDLISLENQALEKTIHEMILWILVTLMFFWIAYSKSILQKMLLAWRKNWIFLLFILFALCSIAWSINIGASVYRGISLIGCSAIAAYTGLTFSNKILFKGFWWFYVFIAIASFTLALFFPSFGTHIGYPYYGAWRGIFWSKNYMGPMMTFGNLVFLFGITLSWKKLLAWLGNILFYLLTALLVYLSKCASALILMVALNLGFLLAFAWVKWKKLLKKKHYIIGAIVSILLIIFIILNLNFFFGLLGRDTSLTGRFPLWSYLIHTGWTNHPILGSGFGATWETNNFRYTTAIAVKWDTTPLVSDNGFIDIFLDLGLIGVALSICVILVCLYRVVKHANKEQTVISFFPVFVVIFVIIVNSTLSFFLNLESFTWFLLVFALFSTTPLPVGKPAESQLDRINTEP